MNDHKHDFRFDQTAPVIDMNPPMYLYRCKCGATTHDPESGALCPCCTPGVASWSWTRPVTAPFLSGDV